ncbi:MAG TPA: glycosyltransferase family 39 protein [Planctomycetota bacterium]|jgi:hypothetical protein|nr:glycosyltransferase family 39 protein [Planctomycetota bacterium]
MKRLPPLGIALAISAIVAVGLLLVAREHELGGYDTEADFYGRYLPESRALLAGEPRFFGFNGPGYPLVLGALSAALGDPFETAKLLSVGSLVVAGLLAFLIGKRALHPEAGLWLQALTLFGAGRFGVLASTEAFFLALVLGTAAALLCLDRGQGRAFFVAGLLAGWATLVRYNGAFLLAWGGWIALGSRVERERIGRRIGRLATLVGGFLVASGWWWFLNWRWNGHPLASHLHLVAASALYGRDVGDQEDLLEAARRFPRLADVLLSRPVEALGRVLSKGLAVLLNLAWAGIQPFGLGPLLVPESDAEEKGPARRMALGFLLAFLPLCLAPHSSRLLVPLLPFAYFFVARGLFRFTRRRGEESRTRRIRRTLALLVPLSLLATAAWKLREYVSSEPVELLRVAELLRAETAGEPTVLAARKPHLAGLSGTESMWPAAAPDEAAFYAALREGNVEFLFVGDREVRAAPFLEGARRGGRPLPGWRPVGRGAASEWALLRKEE